MRHDPLYVSFYTPDYAEQAKRLVASLERWALPCVVELMPDRGTWTKNCAQKPTFVREMMKLQPNRPIVWLDADAEVMSRPYFMRMYSSHVDVARCKYRWWNGKIETFSGTIYFGATDGAKQLVQDWESICTRLPSQWDQHSLAEALGFPGSALDIFDLPVEYCFINDLHREQHPDAEPVIVHYQHSRFTRTKGL